MNEVKIDSPAMFLSWLQGIRNQGGLYFLETTMMENDFKEALSFGKDQRMIRITCCSGQPFMESVLVALAHHINTLRVNHWLDRLMDGPRVNNHTIYQAFLYDCNIYFKEQNVSMILFYVVGQISTFCNDDILLLEQAIQECEFSIIQIVTHSISNNQITNFKTMINIERFDNVHFSYKHLDRHNKPIEKIEHGLVNAGIKYSIDKHLEVGYNIRSYEEEIAKSRLVIVIITKEYLQSIQCMHEITGIVRNGDFDKRVICIAELTDIPRNGDGLKEIKDYWVLEKNRKAEQIKDEPGGSAYLVREIQDIDDIIGGLNKVWQYLTDVLTGSMEDLSNNDGEKIVELVNNSLAAIQKVNVDGMEVVSESTANTFMPPASPKSIQHGDKSIYIEKNDGVININ